MVEEDQVRPLTYASNTTSPNRMNSIDVEEDPSSQPRKTNLRRKRCLQCCGCLSAFLVILAVIFIILIFTVFKVKDPTLTLNSVKFDNITYSTGMNPMNLTTSTSPSVNMTMTMDLSIHNPNYASFKFQNATTDLYYYGSYIGEALNPPGNAKARKTFEMNMTVDLVIQYDSSYPQKVQHLTNDINARSMAIDTYTVMDGRVNVINILKKNVLIKMNCTMTVNLTSMSFESMQCVEKVQL